MNARASYEYSASRNADDGRKHNAEAHRLNPHPA
jgi:hypothetical protein